MQQSPSDFKDSCIDKKNFRRDIGPNLLLAYLHIFSFVCCVFHLFVCFFSLPIYRYFLVCRHELLFPTDQILFPLPVDGAFSSSLYGLLATLLFNFFAILQLCSHTTVLHYIYCCVCSIVLFLPGFLFIFRVNLRGPKCLSCIYNISL